MPHRFPVLERIAFSLFALCAVLDATYIGYEKNPDFRQNVQEIVRIGKAVSLSYPDTEADPWMPLAFS